MYDVIDKQDQQAVRSELSRAPADGEDRVFLCRMNVARNARRQMRFGDQKVSLYCEKRGHILTFRTMNFKVTDVMDMCTIVFQL